jgi:scyllo-inositol 2-dehydrogenase (NADP+)
VSTYIARYDRFVPRLESGWREQPLLDGSGILWDLGSHLVDQALCLFGMPATVQADVGTQRAGAVADDYFHIVLRYGELRAILHAALLVRTAGPRFEVHGDKGSLIKYGRDPQAKMLEDGGRPGDPGWGLELQDHYATLATELGGLQISGRLATAPGAYETFYRQMASAILGDGQPPVAPEEARDTVRILEYALCSSSERKVVAVP